MVTLSAIAKRAKVSVATVSNVLNQRGGYGEETASRILQAAEELGYFRHRRGKRPRQAQTVVAVYRPFPTAFPPDEVPGNFESHAIDAIERYLGTQGYRLVLAGAEGEPDSPLPPALAQQDVVGVLLVGGRFSDRFVQRVLNTDLPTVMVGSIPKVDCNAVSAANRAGMYKATTHLLQHGRRSIAFIKGPPTTATSAEKLLGYMEALRDAGLEPSADLIFDGDFSVESGQRVAHALVQRGLPVDAVLASNDHMAAGCLTALLDHGVAVPQQVAVFGFGDNAVAQLIRPSLSTMRIPRAVIGELAARRLVEMIADPDSLPVQTTVTTPLVVRESCGTLAPTTTPEEASQVRRSF